MLDFINFIPGLGEIKTVLLSILGVLGVVIGAFFSGKKAERNKQKVKDHERADEIRDRIRNDFDDRLREYDDAGFRD